MVALCSHPAARFGTPAAGCCALLAVVVLVLGTFCGTGITCIGTKPAQFFCSLAA